MNRINVIDYYMNIAFAVSLRSTCIRRRVGAIIVKENRILSTGYNGSPINMLNCIDNSEICYRSKHNIPSGKDLHLCRANHSEVNAIMSALKTGEDLSGSSIYITTFPCCNCAKMIIQSGIKEVYYIEGYEDDFSKCLLNEAGLKLIKVDGGKFRAPEGINNKTIDDLDVIDPLVAQIYKYKPGTREFEINRDRIFTENGLYERYDEMIYYTDYSMDQEIIPLTKEVYKEIGISTMNRNELEYNGDFVKQLVVGAVLFDASTNEIVVLKCKGERLKDRFTLVQGHMAIDKKATTKTSLKTIMTRNLKKELFEETTLTNEDVFTIEPLYLIQTNDNKISSEHIGMISLVTIKSTMLIDDLESGEPDKHEVIRLSLSDISNLNVLSKMDTWLRKIIIRMKEDGKF